MKGSSTLLAGLCGALVALGLVGAGVYAQQQLNPNQDIPTGSPAATINLATDEGVGQVKGTWRFKECEIKEVMNQGKRTYDYEPHAETREGRTGAAQAGFDDSSWELVSPPTLKNARGGGKLELAWYRINVTVPERIGAFDPTGSTVVFETTVDDYGEVWVNGQLPRMVGQTGGTVAAGFNVPNRLVVGRNVKPGDKIQLAVFGINSPVSASPGNFIFLRTDGRSRVGNYNFATKLDFYKP